MTIQGYIIVGTETSFLLCCEIVSFDDTYWGEGVVLNLMEILFTLDHIFQV